MKSAIILSIGDELVLGQTVDTNSAWCSRQLAGVGCAVRAHTTVADDQHAIEDAIREAAQRCDFLIITGGIGPTADDLTRQALGAVMNAPLEMNEKWRDHMIAYFKERGRVMPKTNEIQAMIPRGAELIWNHNGTAAGIYAKVSAPKSPKPATTGAPKAASEDMEQMFGRGGEVARIRREAIDLRREIAMQHLHATTDVFVMPGVPKEMMLMFERDVLPRIKSSGGLTDAVILSRTLHTFGLGESAVAEMLGEQMMRNRNPSVGTTVANGIVSLRLNSRFDSRVEAQRHLDETDRACRAALGDLIFGVDDESLQESVARLLVSSRKTVAVAESCTGGLVAKMLTDVSGSSEYFHTGFITYSNKAKYERLGVSMEIINVYGAVSEPVVQAMAKNARRLARSDYALAISGIAGPSGGSARKPVGTVCIALAFDDNDPPVARTFVFPGDREWVRDRAAKMALTMLRYHLLNRPMPV